MGTVQGAGYIGVSGDTVISAFPGNTQTRFIHRGSSPTRNRSVTDPGFQGINRTASDAYNALCSGSALSYTDLSVSSSATSVRLYTVNGTSFQAGRILFYSLGTNLNLALLDARITAYMTAISGL